MKHCAAVVLLGIAPVPVVSAAGGLGVPAELLGTWASTPGDCKHKGNTTIEISEAAVETIVTRGDIISAAPGEKSIEVLFMNSVRGANGSNVRIYRLSLDGRLMEIHGGRVVAMRTRCENSGN